MKARNLVIKFFPVAMGIFYGAMACIYYKSELAEIIHSPRVDNMTIIKLAGAIAIASFLLLSLLYKMHGGIRRLVQILPISANAKKRFCDYNSYSYLALLASIGFLFGIEPDFSCIVIIGAVIIIAQAYMLYAFMDKADRKKLFVDSPNWLGFLFLLSGFAALIYQIVWQRVLFAALGINIESITVIVSVFMFGLGAGALIGGYLQRKFSNLLGLFLFLELSIGVYGVISIRLLHYIGVIAEPTSIITLCLYVYAILAFPALCMGATLPILVAYLNKRFSNLGRSVGLLYAWNTIGGALAAWLTVELFFIVLGQRNTILLAALCNFSTAFFIYRLSKHKLENFADESKLINKPSFNPLPYPLALLLASLIGYIALSQEIIWFRTIGFITATAPQSYGYVLGAYLLGIALSSLKARALSEKGIDPSHYIVRALIIAVVAYYVAFPLIAWGGILAGKFASKVLVYLAAEGIAFITGGIFPLIAYMGISSSDEDAPAKLAKVYFANIVGSVLGPLVTGFILLEYYPLKMNIIIISTLSWLVAFGFILAIKKPLIYKRNAILTLAGILLAIFIAHGPLYENFLEKLEYAEDYFEKEPFKTAIENRSGIITVEASKEGDVVYGNGAYDGRISYDPVLNSNLISRAYMIASLHPNPRRVLVIGLSSGSWTKVFSSYAPIKDMTVIEINKGYINLIKKYPENAPILKNKKITLVIDDGRRWLKANPNEKFDMILMNTIIHWRSSATNLLSKEFLELCKSHLNSGGVMYYNSTGSLDVANTALQVFPYATYYINFVAVSDKPFDLDYKKRKSNYQQFVMDGQPIFNNKYYEKTGAKLANYKLPDLRKELAPRRDLWVITDDNMIAEYRQNHLREY